MAGESDEVSRVGAKLVSLKENPMVFVFLVSFLVGGGSASGILGLSNPRPDPYTGTMGEHESRERREADARLRTELQALKLQVASCRIYRDDHRVESAKGFSRIDHIEKKVAELESEIRAYRGR